MGALRGWVVSTACGQSHLTPVLREGVCVRLSDCRRANVGDKVCVH